MYKNALRSKRLMKEAMISLLKTKSLGEITVTDLVKRAEINRGTFYNHYNNTLDIIEEMRDELVEKLSSGLKAVEQTNDLTTLLDAISEHVKKNEDDYRIIVQAIPTSFVDNMKSQIISQVEKSQTNAPSFGLYFVVNAIAGLYLDYLKGILPYSYDTMTKESKNIVLSLANENK